MSLFNRLKKKSRDIPITPLPEGVATQVRSETYPEKKKLFVPKTLPQWKPGDIILGTYQVENIITTGGMGRIYVTSHLGWKVKVAIKAPIEEMLSEKEFYTRIVREADAWINLGLHPHIAYCYFVRIIEEVPYLFVEYVDGGNLREWVEEGRCADLKVSLDLAIQFCHGMAYAHNKGMIHRDIKPENILMAKDGTLKITDFGIARWGKDETLSSGTTFADGTKTIGFIGTKAYASPEQLRDAHSVGPETDIFSFGVCLWEMLLGRRPYPLAIEKISLPDPKMLNPDLPNPLVSLLCGMVAYEKETRRNLGDFTSLKEHFESIHQDVFHQPSPHKELEKIDLKADGFNNRGISYLELGKEEEALHCFKNAFHEDPQHLEATFNYSYLQWQRTKLTDDVLVTRMKGIEPPNENNPDYWRYLVWIHLERGDIGALEAIQASEHAVTDSGFLKAYANPNKPVGRMVKEFEGHTGPVSSVVFSPDGKYVLSGSWDRTLRLWEVATGSEMQRFEGHKRWVNSVAFSPNGRYALSGSGDKFKSDLIEQGDSSDKTLRLWEVATGQELRRFEEYEKDVYAVCFSPDGRYALSGGCDKTIKLWEVATSKELRQFEGHTGPINAVCFSPDGNYILSGGSRTTLRLWDAHTGQDLRRFEGRIRDISALGFSSDGRYAFSGEFGTNISLWEVATGRELRQFGGRVLDVNAVDFSRGGQYFISGGLGGAVRLWETKTGKQLRYLEGHHGMVLSTCFSPDGSQALSAGLDMSIRLWKLTFGGRGTKVVHLFPVISRITPSTEILAEERRAAILIGSARTHIEKSLFFEAYLLLREVQAKSDRKQRPEVLELITTCGIKGLGVRQSIRSAWQSATLEVAYPISSVCFSPDGRHALSGGADHIVRLWEVGTGKQVRRFEGHTKWVSSVTFSPNGKYALSGSGNPYAISKDYEGFDNALRLWDVQTGEEIRRFIGHTSEVRAVCISSNSEYALSGSDDNTLRLWDIRTGKELRRYVGHTEHVLSVCFSLDGGNVLSGSADRSLRLWDAQTGREIRRFIGHTNLVSSVSFCRDEKFVLSGSWDRTLRLWNLQTGNEVQRFVGHTALVTWVTFSPDGRYALSASYDKTLRLWDVATGKEVRKLEGHTGYVNSVDISADGRYALSGSWDMTIKLWEFDWKWKFSADP